MTQRIRRVSVRESDGQQYIDIPVQIHDRQVTYPSQQGQIQHLQRQIQYWKAKFIHLQSHLQKFQQFKQKYERLIKRNRQLQNDQRQKQSEIEDLKKQFQRKSQQLLQNQRKKKIQYDDTMRSHKIQIQNLKDQLQKYQSKLSIIESQQRKNRRSVQRQLSRIKDQLVDANEQLLINKQSLDRYKGENTILKKKLYETDFNKQIPIQKNYHLTSQVQSLNSQIKYKQDQSLKDKQIIHRLQISLKLQSQKYINLKKQIQQSIIENETKYRKIHSQLDRLKDVEVNLINCQHQIAKLKRILQTKNQQIQDLLHKITNNSKSSARSRLDQQNINQLNKLQSDIMNKQIRHKMQKQQLNERMNHIKKQLDIQMVQKNNIIKQKSFIILSLEKQLQESKRNYKLHESDKHIQTMTILKNKLDESQHNLQELKIIIVRMQDQIKILEKQKQQILHDNKIIEGRCYHLTQEITQLQEHMRNNKYKENYQNNINMAQIEQLYEVKLSNKEELIELLRLKLKNYESGENMFRTNTSFYH